MSHETRANLNVLPSSGAAGKLAELRTQPQHATVTKKLNDETPIDRAIDSSLTTEQRRIKERVIEALQQVYDPELPVNLYDLGLIYRLAIKAGERGEQGGHVVEIDMTLTAPNCPVAEQIPRQVQQAAAAVAGVERVDVQLVWEPKWDKSRMSEAALLELGLL